MRSALVIVATSIAFLLLGIGSVSFLDPDEGMYGSIAREMAGGGDWITPRFNGVRYLSKPPLHFWLGALTIRLFGPSEWAVRLWSALPALATALLIRSIGAIVYGSTAGLLSAVVFITSVGVFVYSRVAMPDLLLVFSLTLAMYGLVRHCTSVAGSQRSTSNVQSPTSNVDSQLPLTNYWAPGAVVFWLGMALGVLSKGLIGAIFPLMTVGLFFAVHRLPFAVHRSLPFAVHRSLFTHPFGWLLFLGLTLPWHLLAGWQNQGFLDFYVLGNQFLRFLGWRGVVEDDVQMGTLAFLAVTAVWFFPWSFFLPAAFYKQFEVRGSKFGVRSSESLRLLAAIWAVTVLAFFSLSRSKLEYYALPAFPAFGLMVGAAWAEARGRKRRSNSGQPTVLSRQSIISGRWSIVDRGLGRSLAVATASCVVVGLGLLGFSHFLSPELLMAGFGQINGYYRTLADQGLGFPFGSVAPFVRFLEAIGVVIALGFPLAYLFFFGRRRQALLFWY